MGKIRRMRTKGVGFDGDPIIWDTSSNTFRDRSMYRLSLRFLDHRDAGALPEEQDGRGSHSRLPADSWPATKVTEEENSRCVRGRFAAAAHPIAAVIPGTISNGMPAVARHSASSPPRPKTT